MKKLFVFFMALSSLLFSDFRSFPWGTEKEFVLKNETDRLDENKDNVVFYQSEINGDKCYSIYFFTNDDKLAQGKYLFLNRYVSESKYIEQYYVLQKLLSKKYGKPNYQDVKYKTDLYEDDIVSGLKFGEVSFICEWENQDSIITLVLYAENYEPIIQIFYESKKYQKQLNNEHENKATENL